MPIKTSSPSKKKVLRGIAPRNEAVSFADLKQDFPIFENHPNLVYLDSAVTSQKPRTVIEAEKKYYEVYCSNVHRGLYKLSEEATEAYEKARKTVAGFIHAASPREIIFTRGTTESINLVAQSYGRKHLKPGDEIIVTLLEHHSNFVPWQMLAQQTGATLRFWDITKEGILQPEAFNKLLTFRPKLLAISQVSNALGTMNDLRWIIQKAHAANVKVVVDAAQSVPHMGVDVEHLDADFIAFSGHKMLGPTGIGVLYAKEKLLDMMDPFMFGGDMIREVHKNFSKWNDLPWKFEAGTPNIAGAIGLGAAVEYLQNIGMHRIREHEQMLLAYAIKKLGAMPEIELFGPCDPERQSGVLSFAMKGVHPHDIAAILDQNNIAIRAGHHCCMPLMERLKVPATARASFYLYNTLEDVDRLVEGLVKVRKIFS